MKLSNCSTLFFALAALIGASSFLSACNVQCPQVRDDYERALRQETQLSQELEEGNEPAQLGVTIKTDLLNDIANTALQTALEAGLQTVSNIDVGGGQRVGINADGDVVNLRIEASDACDHCFRVGGDLDGSVGLDIPAVGEQRANLDGSLSLIAPLIVEQDGRGAGTLKFDLSQAARIGESSLNARLGNVRESWARTLQSELSDRLLDDLIDDLEPIDLVSFDNPDFGIPGLEVFPVELATDARSETIFAGFSTNIDALEGAPAIEPVTRLDDDQNLALTFNPNLVLHGVSLMMQKDVVARTYSSDGQPARRGPAHATIQDFSFSEGRVGELPMDLDFRIFNLGNGDTDDQTQMCYWFEGRASGRIALRGENLEVSLTDIDIIDSSLPTAVVQATRWRQADFLDGGIRLVRASLDEDNVEVPGGRLDFAGLSIELLNNQVVLKGASAVREGRARLE